MRLVKSWRGPRATIAAASGMAIAAASLTVAAPAALAGVTGFVNGPVGVAQNIVVDGLTENDLGQSTCTMVPTINGVQQSSVDGPFTSGGQATGSATFRWTPLTTGAATFTLSNCSGLTNPGAVTISPVATTTTISAPNTRKGRHRHQDHRHRSVQ